MQYTTVSTGQVQYSTVYEYIVQYSNYSRISYTSNFVLFWMRIRSSQ